MGIKFTNNASSVLASGINDSVTSLSVQAGDGAKFPTLGAGDYFYCTLETGSTREIVKVTARTTDTFTVERGQEGTTATSWSAGSVISHRVTAGSLTALSTIPPLTTENRTSNTQIVAADKGKLINITSGSFDQTFDTPANLGAGWWCYYKNSGTGDIAMPTTLGSEIITNGAMDTFGSELITNGSFATDTDWTKGAGWTISGGVANASATTGNLTSTSLSAATVGAIYKITYTITVTSGTVRAIIGGTNGTTQSASGTYTDYLTAVNTNAFSMDGVTAFTGTVDNVSCVRLNGWEDTVTTVAYDGVNGEFDFASYGNALYAEAVRQTIPALTAGALYEVTYTISNYSGSGYIGVAFNNTQRLTGRNANGTYTERFIASGEHTILHFAANFGSFTGSVSDVSLKIVSEGLQGHTNPWSIYPNEMRLFWSDGSNIDSVVVNSYSKTFTASGTYYEPPGYSRHEGLLWGGGGRGLSSANIAIPAPGTAYTLCGGGGGACNPLNMPTGIMVKTVTIAAGSGDSNFNGAYAYRGGDATGASSTTYVGGGGTLSAGSYSTTAEQSVGQPMYSGFGGGVQDTSTTKLKTQYGGGSGVGGAGGVQTIYGGAGFGATIEFSGTEKVLTPDFASDTNWTKGTGWTISGGVAVATNVSTGTLSQTLTLTSGVTYIVQFTVSGVSGGEQVTVALGSTSKTVSANGTYSFIRTAAATSESLVISNPLGSGTPLTCTVDNVYCRQLVSGTYPAPSVGLSVFGGAASINGIGSPRGGAGGINIDATASEDVYGGRGEMQIWGII